MKSAFTLFFKEVKQNIISFLLVLLTVFLCVSVVSGMLLYAFTLESNAEKYFDDSQMWDIKIKSTLGFTREDVISVSSANGVDKATAAILGESNSAVNGMGNFGTTIYAIDFDSVTANPDSIVSAPRLIKGSYPGNANSCVAVISHSLNSDIKVGDVITLAGNTGYCTQTEFTVTGLVYTPDFSSYLEEKNIENGTGIVIFVRTDAFSPDAPYTEINVTLKDAKALKSFSREYTLFVNTAMGPINVVAREREQKRGAGITDEIQADIDKLLKQYDYIKAEGESELGKLDKIIKNMKKGIDDTDRALESQKKDIDELKEAVALSIGLPEYSQKLAEYNQRLLQYQSDFETNEMNKSTCEKLQEDYENLDKTYSKKAEEALKKYQDAKNNTQTNYSQRWTLYTRDSNNGFTSIKQNIGKISAMFLVPPIVIVVLTMLLIVATIILNTQKRAKEISLLLVSGVNAKTIKIRVTILYLLAAFLGLILGVIASINGIPSLLSKIIGLIYDLPLLSLSALPYVALLVGFILLVVTIIATWVLFGRLLSCEAYQLIYGKTLLENPKYPKFSAIEKSHAFIKVLIRNIWCNKINFLYGCITVLLITILLFTGFNVAGRENGVYENQYTKIQKYNTEVQLKQFVNIEENESFMAYLDGKQYLPIIKKNICIFQNEKDCYLTAIVPVSANNFSEFIKIKGNFDAESVVITRDFAKRNGIKKGSQINVTLKDGIKKMVSVTAVTDNYLGDYIYIHPEKYAELTGETNSANTVLIKHSYEKGIDEAVKLLETGIVYSVDELKVNYGMATLNFSKVLVYLASAFGFVILAILYYVTYKNRRIEIKALKFSGIGGLKTYLYFLSEMAIMWFVGAFLGILCGVLTNLPFALLNLNGINLSSFISVTALFKTLVVSFDITLIAYSVNISLRYKKTDR